MRKDYTGDALDLGFGDRILLAIFAPVVGCFMALIGIGAVRWNAASWRGAIIQFIVAETAFATSILAFLICAWAVSLHPTIGVWLRERMLRTLLLLFVCGSGLVALAFLAMILY